MIFGSWLKGGSINDLASCGSFACTCIHFISAFQTDIFHCLVSFEILSTCFSIQQLPEGISVKPCQIARVSHHNIKG
jgi:hypothetical protein